MDLRRFAISKSGQLAKRSQTMTVRIDKSGLISLSSHNGFLSYRRTESWESRPSLPKISELVFILSPLFHSFISAWSVTSRLQGLWRPRIRFWCWVLTLGSEVWLRKPPSLPPSPLLCSLWIPFFSLSLSLPWSFQHSLLFYIPHTLAPRYLTKTAEVYEI